MPGTMHHPVTRTAGRSIALSVMALPGVSISDAVAAARREPIGIRAALPQKPTFSYRTAAALGAA